MIFNRTKQIHSWTVQLASGMAAVCRLRALQARKTHLSPLRLLCPSSGLSWKYLLWFAVKHHCCVDLLEKPMSPMLCSAPIAVFRSEWSCLASPDAPNRDGRNRDGWGGAGAPQSGLNCVGTWGWGLEGEGGGPSRSRLWDCYSQSD